jgi:hypothetical protein
VTLLLSPKIDMQSLGLHVADRRELIRVHGARVNNLKDVFPAYFADQCQRLGRTSPTRRASPPLRPGSDPGQGIAASIPHDSGG